MTSTNDKRLHVYHITRGGHIHMRLFMNGSKLGDMICRVSEWDQLQRSMTNCVFIEQQELIEGIEK